MAEPQSRSSRSAGTSAAPAGQAATPGPARPLDDADRRLVAELVADARLSVRTLAERLHISRANAYARLERLQRTGVITGFTARFAPERAGLATTAYVSVNIEQNTWRSVSAELAELPYVESIALLASEFDVLVLVHAPDNATLRTLVLERVQAIPGVIATRTWLAFEEIRGKGPFATA
ncbi:Lrp/AsnC family transcriptional regulator [Luteipulveratus halotolerans]|uniref:AsnC family transcriptional regulator n=1 Tax=Luteipulveratus halotolerans TaxID=1631356 RepID=A0A0L6CLR0_9MICO|nr:Lrp/AsnC family transcriptional regulator [Luteipulveratus halotolerans]KNX38448.1 AsnC family transcriptional regulator [Luteipulveratus halotolerans]